MEPLLFADHLRRLRNPLDQEIRARRPRFDLSGAARLVGAACTVCLLLVMLQLALSAPISSPAVAIAAEEPFARSGRFVVCEGYFAKVERPGAAGQ